MMPIIRSAVVLMNSVAASGLGAAAEAGPDTAHIIAMDSPITASADRNASRRPGIEAGARCDRPVPHFLGA
jgi:hypothetical protein